MRAYTQYCLLTAALLCIGIYALYAGILPWMAEKFPDTAIHIVIASLLGVFLWTYALVGHGAALTIARNERVLRIWEAGGAIISLHKESEVEKCVRTAAESREKGLTHGLSDFTLLYERIISRFEDVVNRKIETIEFVRTLLFLIGLACTLTGIIWGFASQAYPTNPEENKIYSFTIIKALGLAYVPTYVCIMGAIVLSVLSQILNTKAKQVVARFEDLLFSEKVFNTLHTRHDVAAPMTQKRRGR